MHGVEVILAPPLEGLGMAEVFGLEVPDLDLTESEFVTGVFVAVKIASGETAWITRTEGLQDYELLGMLEIQAHKLRVDAYHGFTED